MEGTIASGTENDAGSITFPGNLKSFDDWQQCFDGMSAMLLKDKLLELDFEKQLQLLNWQDGDGKTILFTISEPAKLQMLLEVVPRKKRLQLFSKQDHNQRTFLHMDIPIKMLNIVSHVLRSFEAQQRMKLALITDSNGETFLFNKSCNAVIKLLSAFPADDIFLLCTKKNLSGSTFLHLVGKVTQIMNIMPENQRDELLTLTNANGETVFETEKDYIDASTAKVAEGQSLDMLTATDKSGCPAIHSMIGLNDISEVLSVVKSFPVKHAYILLTLKGKGKQNTMTKICSSKTLSAKHIPMLHSIFASLDPYQGETLMRMKGEKGKTVFHLLESNTHIGFNNALPILGTLGPEFACSILTRVTIWNKNHTSLFTKLFKPDERSLSTIIAIFTAIPTCMWFVVANDSLGTSESFKVLTNLLDHMSTDDRIIFALGRKLGENKSVYLPAQQLTTTVCEAYTRNLLEEMCLIMESVPPTYCGAVLGKTNSIGQNMLHRAIIQADHKTIDRILNWCHNDSICSLMGVDDQRSETVLHHAARTGSQSLRKILNTFCFADDLPGFVTKQNKHGKTILHLAIESRHMYRTNLQTILSCCSQLFKNEETMGYLITLQDRHGDTASHCAAAKDYRDSLLTMMKFLNPRTRQRALALQNERGDTVLHCAASHKDLRTLSALLDHIELEPEAFLPLVKIKNKQELSVLASALRYHHRPLWRILVQKLPAKSLYEVVREQDLDGRTLLHLSWAQKQYKMIHDIVKILGFDQSVELLMILDGDHHTALGKAIVLATQSQDNTERWDQLLGFFLREFSCVQLAKLLTIPAKVIPRSSVADSSSEQIQYPLHLITNEKVFSTLIESLAPMDILGILSLRSSDGTSVLYHAASLKHSQSHKPIEVCLQRLPCCQEAEVLVNSLHVVVQTACTKQNSNATVAKAIGMWKDMRSLAKISGQRVNQSTDKQQMIEELTRNYILGPEDIATLSPLSDKYILPWRQERVKQWALVFYNTHKAEGAAQEAENMALSLEEAGFSFVLEEWKCRQTLLDRLQKHLDHIANKLSLLTVCIMSHGITGNLIDSNSKKLAISDMLQLINQTIPQHVPLIVIIQACQSFNREAKAASYLDASGGRDPSPYINLYRQHSCLLLSSVIGGASVRGAYTGALAQQFRNADGKTSFSQMITDAKIQMQRTHPESKNQVPDTRDTLMKRLVLPPASSCDIDVD